MREYEGAREHLDDVIALVERMLERHRRSGATTEPDLRALAELDVDIARRDELITARRDATPLDRLPLERLRAAFALSPTEARVLAVLCALEVSASVRRAAAELLDPHATVELVEALVYAGPARALRSVVAIELAPDGALFRHRLAVLGNPELPWLARSLRVAPRVLELAMGRIRLDLEVARLAALVDEPGGGDDLLVDAGVRALVTETLARGGIPYLVGPRGSGRASLALAAAAAQRRSVLVVQAGRLPREAAAASDAMQSICREAALFDTMLLVRDLDALGELVPAVVAVLAAHTGGIAITAERAVWPAGAARSVVVAELATPGEADRATLWLRQLGDRELATRAAERYRVTGGVIENAARTARQHAEGRRAPVGLADVRAGIRGELDAELSTLGTLVEWSQTWDDLVLADEVMGELVEMVSRIRFRRRVLDDWGFERKVGKGVGVSALFSGPPGTGKTMVAGLIANELELDLYQIDVSRMVSKWVGETEKNLARLFDAAATGHAVLLFDEADSLFAKRTEVKSSNDRYANLEVNYLLQRMEAFDGITILTTNHETAVDDAFRRRLAFRIQFGVPELAERVRLWHAMLPAQAAVAAGIDFTQLARRFEMTGGYIRNAVLRAAYLAAADNAPIGMAHLQRAATLEYAAMGMITHGA